jgi:hypothetical protein
MRDLHNNINITQVLDPVVVTADVESTAIDMQGYDSLELVVLMGESGDTLSGSLYTELILQEGAESDGSDAAAVAQNDAIGTVTSGVFATVDAAAEDDAVFKIGYIGDARYVRVAIDVTGTHTNGTPIGIIAIRSNAEKRPVA